MTTADGKKPPTQIWQFIAAVTVNLNAASYGVALGWAANALPYLQGPDSPVPLNQDEASWVVSMLLLGAAIATPFLSLLPDRIGRKMTGYLAASFMTTGWLVILFAGIPTHLYIGRFMCGVSGGVFLVLSPLYVVEIADTNIRGKLGSLSTVQYNGAVALAYIYGAFVSYFTVIYISLAVPILFAVVFFWMPETPKYLLRNGKIKEARKSLEWFRGKECDVTAELESIQETIKVMETSQASLIPLKDIIFNRGSLRGLIFVIILAFNHQLSGISPVLNYTNQIFQEAGSTLLPIYSTIIVGLLQFSGNILSLFLVERAGRKILLVISDSLMALSLLVLGTYFYLKSIDFDVTTIGWLPVSCLGLFVVSLSIGLGPIIYVVLTEITHPRIIWLAQQMCCFILWFMAFIMTKYFYILSDSLTRHGCYWLFAACCSASVFFIIFFLPETKGKSLQDIQMELRGVKKSKDVNDVPIV